MDTIVAKIEGLLRDSVDALSLVDLTPTTPLISSGYMESYEVIELISALEGAFGISVPLVDLELEDFDTVESIAQVCARLGAKG